MIKDIENKKINLVIVKDLSRFGRLSSKISYYLEEFFIEKSVRFIAVADDIDIGHIETSEKMVQFKAFFNEWLLRDTSRKVRNGKTPTEATNTHLGLCIPHSNNLEKVINCVLEELNVSGFDTKNVTSMFYMFRDCNSLKSLDLNSFTTTNVTNMQRMFQRCSSLEILNIKNFDMTNVSDFTYMLDGVNNNIIIKTNDNMKIFIDTNFSKYSTNVEV